MTRGKIALKSGVFCHYWLGVLSPALSQTSRGQRVKRERLGTRLRAYVISARKTKHLDVKTMFTYSHANTPLGQSERAYYLSYFIKYDITESYNHEYNKMIMIKS